MIPTGSTGTRRLGCWRCRRPGRWRRRLRHSRPAVACGFSAVSEWPLARWVTLPTRLTWSRAVSHQLRLRRHLGLVLGERIGRRTIYALQGCYVGDLLEEAVFHVQHLRHGLAVKPGEPVGPCEPESRGTCPRGGRQPGQCGAVLAIGDALCLDTSRVRPRSRSCGRSCARATCARATCSTPASEH